MANPLIRRGAPFTIVVIVLVLIGMNFYKTIPPGQVGVAALFGNVQPIGFEQGLHIPVNPLYSWTLFDARQQTHLSRSRPASPP